VSSFSVGVIINTTTTTTLITAAVSKKKKKFHHTMASVKHLPVECGLGGGSMQAPVLYKWQRFFFLLCNSARHASPFRIFILLFL
jgi:4-diphosphocytidyl-2C-methyl-D-erythritol kinase